MHIDLAFFKGDHLIAKGSVICGEEQSHSKIKGDSNINFHVAAKHETPACPVEIDCFQDDQKLYRAALRVGVHTSEDWESVDLAGIHTLGFRCHNIENNA